MTAITFYAFTVFIAFIFKKCYNYCFQENKFENESCMRLFYKPV